MEHPDEALPSRHARRKARTRTRIAEAAGELFARKGYHETSIEDISARADVAVRTVYTHFPSKAAILLDHFDRWLDALVEGILARPADEPIAESVGASLRAMSEAGWTDRSYGDVAQSPPSALGLFEGPPEVAGSMMHAWARAQHRIAADCFERGGHAADSLVPHARAAAVFAACMGPILAARMSRDAGSLPGDATANTLIAQFIAELTRGGL